MNKKISTPLAILIILLIIAIIIGVTLWIYLIKDIVSPQDETTDWNTYRNEKYGYEIKYPEKWTFDDSFGPNKERPYSAVMFSPPDSKSEEIFVFTDFQIAGLTRNLSLKESLKIMGGHNFISQEDINVNNYRAIKTEQPGPENSYSIYIMNDDRIIYRLTLTSINSPFLNIFNQMLSTFRFLE